jgi:CelD/BcsL family acetyltransferase involved in cellulose biosynthesis
MNSSVSSLTPVNVLVTEALQPNGIRLDKFDPQSDLSHLSLATKNGQIFQSLDWLRVLAAHDNAKGCIPFLLTFDQDRVVLPLSLGREGGLKTARIMGESIAQYSDCAGPGLSAQRLKQGLQLLKDKEGVDLLILRRVRQDAAISSALDGLKALSTEPNRAPWINLQDITNKRPRPLLDSQRLHRRLKEKVSTSFVFYKCGAEISAILDLSFDWKRDWAKTSALPSRFISEPNFKASLLDYFTHAKESVRVGVLYAEGKPIALEAGFTDGHRFYDFMRANHPNWRIHGAGSIVMGEMAMALHEDGIRVYDQLAPDDPYKLMWSKTCIDVADRIVPLSVLGAARAYFIDGTLLPLAKNLVRQMPPQWRKTILALAGRQ